MNDTIRPITFSDLPLLKKVIDSTELFPSDLLDEMTSHFLNNNQTEEIWLTKTHDQIPISVLYCAPERLTDGTYNLYLIAVHKKFQGKGVGKELINYLENKLTNEENRILIVETSDLPEFELTRKFYDECGYTREARIREFYKSGEGKIIFWKKLI